ncbi:MAG TPA: DNA/RNA nuclease SfsA [Methanothrix sp.]|nr:DNA/RNA nuclease SfsA [Methanothrix sp.]
MKLEGELVPAVFLERRSRFSVVVARNGKKFEAFLANSGRLKEILVPGRKLLLRAVYDRPERKTGFDLFGAILDGSLVTIDSRLPNALVKEAILGSSLPEFCGYRLVKDEPVFGRGRFDFLLEPSCFLEVKGCTLVRDGVALFPDAPTLRGRRHLDELARAKQEGHRACVIFVVQRDDTEVFRPNWDTDPAFAQALIRAMAGGGVEAFAYASRCLAGELNITQKLNLQALEE